MTDVIALSELSDEPRVADGVIPHWKLHVSPRLDAVLDRLPVRNTTGTPTRIRGRLRNAGIKTLAHLQTAENHQLSRKGIGSAMQRDIDAALAAFDLARCKEPLVVRDGASANDAHVQRLQKWIEDRIAECVADQDRFGAAGASHQTTEQEVLTDVMLLLDGREPMNKRRWFGCRDDVDCEREYGHDGPHRRTIRHDDVEETEAWP